MSQGLGQVYVDVTAKATSATNSLNNLAKVLERVQGKLDSINTSKLDGAFSGADKISSFSTGIQSVAKALQSLSRIKTNNLDATISRLRDIAGIDFTNLESLQGIDFTGFSKAVTQMSKSSKGFAKTVEEITEATDKMKESPEEAREAFDQMSDDGSASIERMRALMLGIPAVTNVITGSISRVISGMGDIAFGIGKAFELIIPTLAKVGSYIAKFSANLAKMTVTKTVSGIKSLGTELLKTATGFSIINSKHSIFSKGLNGGFMTVLRYAFGIRSLFVLFNKLRNVITNGMKNLAIQNASVNSSVSLLMNSLNSLKGSVISGFAPALNAIAGPLSSLINLFADGAAKVAGFISALTGKNMMITSTAKAADYAADLAKSAGGAGGGMGKAADEAKDLKKTLATMSFDELNQLQEKKDAADSGGSGGGGGGGGGGTAQSQITYEETEIPQSIKDFVNLIKQSWEEADFTYIGHMIGDKINDALQKIPWDKIQETSNKAGKSLATLLNGILESELDGTPLSVTFGNTVAQALNTVLTGINGFVTNIHWDSIGSFVKNGVKTALSNINYDDLESNSKAIGGGIATAINKFITPDSFAVIGQSLARVLNSAVSGVHTFVTTADFSEWGKSIATAANNFFKDFDFGLAASTFSSAVTGLLNALGSAITNIDWELLGYKLRLALLEVDWNGILSGVWNVIKSTFIGLLSFADAFGSDSEFAATMVGIRENIAEAKNLLAEGDDQASKADGFCEYIERLARDYETLSQKGDLLTETEKAKLKFVSEELVGAIPELKKYYDEESGMLRATTQEVDAYVEAIKKKAIAEAQQDALKSYAKAQVEAKMALEESTKNLRDNEAEQNGLKETLKDLAKQYEDGKISELDYENAQTQVMKRSSELNVEHRALEKSYREAQSTFDEADRKFSEMATSIGSVDTATDSAKLSIDKFKANLVNIPESLKIKMSVEGVDSLSLSEKMEVVASVVGVDVSDLPHDQRKIEDMYAEIAKAQVQPGYEPKLDAFGNIRGVELDQNLGKPNIDTTGNIVEAKDSVPASQKSSNGWLAEFTKKTYDAGASTIKGFVASFTKKQYKAGTSTISGFVAKFTNFIWSAGKTVSGFVAKITDFFKKERGGVFDGNFWKNIPQFAGGGSPSHGTMFVAGESGAEIVGSINGRTEVLNASQIASAIYSAVVSAMNLTMNSYLQPVIAGVKDLMIECANSINTNLGYIDDSLTNLQLLHATDSYFTASDMESRMTSGMYKGFEMIRGQGFCGITKEEMEAAVTNGYLTAMAMTGGSETTVNVTGNIIAPDGRRLASYVMQGLQENNRLGNPTPAY